MVGIAGTGTAGGRLRVNGHEVRDPIHGFIRYDADERRIIDSPPVQRLRHIHQLATTFLVYPGATHKRFEHSLGVMDLAGRIYDVIVSHPMDLLHDIVPKTESERDYWKRVLRLAALLHDVGHLPFSHAAEGELLPDGYSHEMMSADLIATLSDALNSLTPPIRAIDVAKVAVGPKILRDETFSAWEEVLSEIIVDDALGADRMDYLLRDSHHLGVAYGHFDLARLVSEIRVLPRTHGSEELALGLEQGGSHAAEGLQLARYFMFTQVYFHPVRRSYDMLLKEFLKEWLAGGSFSTDPMPFLALTDNEILAAIRSASADKDAAGHGAARRFGERGHYRLLYEWNAADARRRPDVVDVLYEEAAKEFGQANLRVERYPAKDTTADFPVRLRDGRMVSATSVSEVFRRVPPAKFEFVFVVPEYVKAAHKWLPKKLQTLLQMKGGLNGEPLGA
jgi:HD superfamily phosphohydrolase